MSKMLNVVYAVKLAFTGSDAVWLRFNGGWCPKVDFEAEFVGFDHITGWLNEQIGQGDFVPAYNLGGYETELQNFRTAHLLNFDSDSGSYRDELPDDMRVSGSLFHYTSDESAECKMLLAVYPVSICTYEDSGPIQITCIYNQSVKVVFTGDDLSDVYTKLIAGLGTHFANATMALYEMADCPEVFDVKLRGVWEVKVERGSIGTNFVRQDDVVDYNPSLNGFEIEVRTDGADGAVRTLAFDTDAYGNVPSHLIEELEERYNYDAQQHRNALSLYQLVECPYYEENGAHVVVDDGDFSVRVRAIR